MEGGERLRDLAIRAYAAMSATFEPAPAHLIPSFRLWHFPAAGPHVSWTVLHCRETAMVKPEPMLRQLLWDRDRDMDRLELAPKVRAPREPSLIQAEISLDKKTLWEFMDQARSLQCAREWGGAPYIADQRTEFGLEPYDLEGTDGRPIVRLEWDRPHPRHLDSIVDWADRVRAWLRQTLT